MEYQTIYIQKIKINKVRHLESIEIPISIDSKKHLIITGKNGSGKTSLLEGIAVFLHEAFYRNTNIGLIKNQINTWYERVEYLKQTTSISDKEAQSNTAQEISSLQQNIDNQEKKNFQHHKSGTHNQ